MNKCHCGSGKTYPYCCKPFITGKKKPETALQLMRARYTAYVDADMDFIHDTTHPQNRADFDRESSYAWSVNSVWEGLDIIETKLGGKEDNKGEVEFAARYQENGNPVVHHEIASFEKLEGEWYFVDGYQVKPKPIISNKVGRNEPCPCGSGLKYKKCCAK
jgi:SEC-C motif-containing protein